MGITEIENDGKSLWVINSSSQILTINVNNSNGTVKTLKLEKTWVPQDLSMQALADDIIMSPDFRRARAMELIRVQDANKVADLFKRDPEAKAEYQRIVTKSNISSVLEKTSVQVVDTAREASADEILVTTVFGKPNEKAVKNEIRVLHTSNKLNESAILALAKKADELGYTDVLALLKTYA